MLTTQSFSINMNEGDRLSFLEQLGCPVLQVPVALCGREAWLNNTAGLPPAEVAMNVALPEIDGRMFSTVAGFKEEDQVIAEVQFRAKRLKPDLAQIFLHARMNQVRPWRRGRRVLRRCLTRLR